MPHILPELPGMSMGIISPNRHACRRPTPYPGARTFLSAGGLFVERGHSCPRGLPFVERGHSCPRRLLFVAGAVWRKSLSAPPQSLSSRVPIHRDEGSASSGDSLGRMGPIGPMDGRSGSVGSAHPSQPPPKTRASIRGTLSNQALPSLVSEPRF